MTSFRLDAIQEKNKPWARKKWDALTTFLEENRQNIFYLFVFYVITIALFIERFIREFPLTLFYIYFLKTVYHFSLLI
jgi:dual oxidase